MLAVGVVANVVALAAIPLWAALADRIGRKPVFLIGSLFTIAFGIPMFLMVNTGAVIMVVVAVALSLLLSHDPIFAVESSWFSEQFPRDVRSSGISLGYNGASLIAGLLPFLATALYGSIGWIGPAVLFMLLGVVSTIAAALTSETAPVKIGAPASSKTTPATV